MRRALPWSFVAQRRAQPLSTMLLVVDVPGRNVGELVAMTTVVVAGVQLALGRVVEGLLGEAVLEEHVWGVCWVAPRPAE